MNSKKNICLKTEWNKVSHFSTFVHSEKKDSHSTDYRGINPPSRSDYPGFCLAQIRGIDADALTIFTIAC